MRNMEPNSKAIDEGGRSPHLMVTAPANGTMPGAMSRWLCIAANWFAIAHFPERGIDSSALGGTRHGAEVVAPRYGRVGGCPTHCRHMGGHALVGGTDAIYRASPGIRGIRRRTNAMGR